MAQMAQRISKNDKKELIDLLQSAYAEEWLAYYQYWIGAEVAEGIERPKVVEEFKEHANEELKHASWLSQRIIELGETPILNPNKWEEHAKCKYDAPTNPDTKVLVAQNLVAERCAIGRYQNICELCQGKDYITFNIARKILKEEIEHEQEMEDFQKDFEYY
jgi:bacterioferritin